MSMPRYPSVEHHPYNVPLAIPPDQQLRDARRSNNQMGLHRQPQNQNFVYQQHPQSNPSSSHREPQINMNRQQEQNQSYKYLRDRDAAMPNVHVQGQPALAHYPQMQHQAQYPTVQTSSKAVQEAASWQMNQYPRQQHQQPQQQVQMQVQDNHQYPSYDATMYSNPEVQGLANNYNSDASASMLYNAPQGSYNLGYNNNNQLQPGVQNPYGAPQQQMFNNQATNQPQQQQLYDPSQSFINSASSVPIPSPNIHAMAYQNQADTHSSNSLNSALNTTAYPNQVGPQTLNQMNPVSSGSVRIRYPSQNAVPNQYPVAEQAVAYGNQASARQNVQQSGRSSQRTASYSSQPDPFLFVSPEQQLLDSYSSGPTADQSFYVASSRQERKGANQQPSSHHRHRVESQSLPVHQQQTFSDVAQLQQSQYQMQFDQVQSATLNYGLQHQAPSQQSSQSHPTPQSIPQQFVLQPEVIASSNQVKNRIDIMDDPHAELITPDFNFNDIEPTIGIAFEKKLPMPNVPTQNIQCAQEIFPQVNMNMQNQMHCSLGQYANVSSDPIMDGAAALLLAQKQRAAHEESVRQQKLAERRAEEEQRRAQLLKERAAEEQRLLQERDELEAEQRRQEDERAALRKVERERRREEKERQQREALEKEERLKEYKRREAEERLKREAEMQKRREVEEQRRKDAEELQRKEAEEQKKRDAEEQRRREIEEQERRDAEALKWKEAEEQRRLEAEKQERKRAERQKRKEAEDLKRKQQEEEEEEERKAKLKAKERRRKELEEQEKKKQQQLEEEQQKMRLEQLKRRSIEEKKQEPPPKRSKLVNMFDFQPINVQPSKKAAVDQPKIAKQPVVEHAKLKKAAAVHIIEKRNEKERPELPIKQNRIREEEIKKRKESFKALEKRKEFERTKKSLEEDREKERQRKTKVELQKKRIEREKTEKQREVELNEKRQAQMAALKKKNASKQPIPRSSSLVKTKSTQLDRTKPTPLPPPQKIVEPAPKKQRMAVLIDTDLFAPFPRKDTLKKTPPSAPKVVTIKVSPSWQKKSPTQQKTTPISRRATPTSQKSSPAVCKASPLTLKQHFDGRDSNKKHALETKLKRNDSKNESEKKKKTKKKEEAAPEVPIQQQVEQVRPLKRKLRSRGEKEKLFDEPLRDEHRPVSVTTPQKVQSLGDPDLYQLGSPEDSPRQGEEWQSPLQKSKTGEKKSVKVEKKVEKQHKSSQPAEKAVPRLPKPVEIPSPVAEPIKPKAIEPDQSFADQHLSTLFDNRNMFEQMVAEPTAEETSFDPLLEESLGEDLNEYREFLDLQVDVQEEDVNFLTENINWNEALCGPNSFLGADVDPFVPQECVEKIESMGKTIVSPAKNVEEEKEYVEEKIPCVETSVAEEREKIEGLSDVSDCDDDITESSNYSLPDFHLCQEAKIDFFRTELKNIVSRVLKFCVISDWTAASTTQTVLSRLNRFMVTRLSTNSYVKCIPAISFTNMLHLCERKQLEAFETIGDQGVVNVQLINQADEFYRAQRRLHAVLVSIYAANLCEKPNFTGAQSDEIRRQTRAFIRLWYNYNEEELIAVVTEMCVDSLKPNQTARKEEFSVIVNGILESLLLGNDRNDDIMRNRRRHPPSEGILKSEKNFFAQFLPNNVLTLDHLNDSTYLLIQEFSRKDASDFYIKGNQIYAKKLKRPQSTQFAAVKTPPSATPLNLNASFKMTPLPRTSKPLSVCAVPRKPLLELPVPAKRPKRNSAVTMNLDLSAKVADESAATEIPIVTSVAVESYISIQSEDEDALNVESSPFSASSVPVRRPMGKQMPLSFVSSSDDEEDDEESRASDATPSPVYATYSPPTTTTSPSPTQRIHYPSTGKRISAKDVASYVTKSDSESDDASHESKSDSESTADDNDDATGSETDSDSEVSSSESDNEEESAPPPPQQTVLPTTQPPLACQPPETPIRWESCSPTISSSIKSPLKLIIKKSALTGSPATVSKNYVSSSPTRSQFSTPPKPVSFSQTSIDSTVHRPPKKSVHFAEPFVEIAPSHFTRPDSQPNPIAQSAVIFTQKPLKPAIIIPNETSYTLNVDLTRAEANESASATVPIPLNGEAIAQDVELPTVSVTCDVELHNRKRRRRAVEVNVPVRFYNYAGRLTLKRNPDDTDESSSDESDSEEEEEEEEEEEFFFKPPKPRLYASPYERAYELKIQELCYHVKMANAERLRKKQAARKRKALRKESVKQSGSQIL